MNSNILFIQAGTMVALAYDNGEVQIMTTTMSSSSSAEDSMQNIKLTLAVNECLGWIEIISEEAEESILQPIFSDFVTSKIPKSRTTFIKKSML